MIDKFFGTILVIFFIGISLCVYEVAHKYKTISTIQPMEIHFTYAGRILTTAYVAKDGHPWHDGRGATLYPAAIGMVAADWDKFPPGTILYISGYGYGIVLDKGSAIKGNRLDIFVETKKEAIEWGKKKVDVWVLGRIPIQLTDGKKIGGGEK